MTNTFRAAYLVTTDGQSDVLLTTADDAHLSDAELTELAVAEAHNAGLIGDDADANQVTEADLRDRLSIGDYNG